jgi:hypothetical protein
LESIDPHTPQKTLTEEVSGRPGIEHHPEGVDPDPDPDDYNDGSKFNGRRTVLQDDPDDIDRDPKGPGGKA